ncbi:MAG: hypothetical protein Q9175_006703 [Cornicularia normoerica]
MSGIKHPRSDDEIADPPPLISPLMAMFETFRTELDEHHDRRERIIKASRDITALSKKVIFSLQRYVPSMNRVFSANTENNPTRVRQLQAPIPPAISKDISSYQTKITDLFISVAPDLQDLNAWRYQSQISSGIQEYMEAVSFQHYLETQRLISYKKAQAQIPGKNMLTEDDYVLGLFDLVGELMRFAITSMAMNGALPRGAAKEVGEGRDILTDLRQMRAAFEGLDGAGRRADRKMDVMRTCVEKVEGAVYGMIVRGRERPKGWVMDVGEERRGEVESY